MKKFLLFGALLFLALSGRDVIFTVEKRVIENDCLTVTLAYRNAKFAIATQTLRVIVEPDNVDAAISFDPIPNQLLTSSQKNIFFIRNSGMVICTLPADTVAKKFKVRYALLDLLYGEIGKEKEVVAEELKRGNPALYDKKNEEGHNDYPSEKKGKSLLKIIKDFIASPLDIINLTKNNLIFLTIILLLLGILMGLTPCIYPMIPITLGIIGIGKESPFYQKITKIAFYALGVAITFSLLGLAAASGGMVIGGLFSHWIFSVGVGVLLILFGLIQMGVIAINIFPQISVPAPFVKRLGFFAPFFFGMLSGTITCPCVSPGLAALLTLIAEWKEYFLGWYMLFIFGIGLSLPLFIIGVFGHLASSIMPRSGIWMDRVKIFIGLCVIVVGLFFIFQGSKVFFEKKERKKELFCKIENSSEYEKLLLTAIKENKNLFILFSAPWCSACQSIKKKLKKDLTWIENMKKIYILLSINIDEKNDFVEGLIKEYGIVGVPTFITLKNDGKIIMKCGSDIESKRDLLLHPTV